MWVEFLANLPVTVLGILKSSLLSRGGTQLSSALGDAPSAVRVSI